MDSDTQNDTIQASSNQSNLASIVENTIYPASSLKTIDGNIERCIVELHESFDNLTNKMVVVRNVQYKESPSVQQPSVNAKESFIINR